MKKILLLLITTLIVLSVFVGCAQQAQTPVQTPAPATPAAAETPVKTEEPIPQTMQFTDSIGRTSELPSNITKVAVSGPLAQIALFALCPDKLVGLASAWDTTAEQYLKTEYYNLPEIGQLYGSKGELNLEALLASGAEVVIDVGEPKETMAEDFDALEEQTGIPFVHITATMTTMGDAYTKLGELLNMPEEAKALAEYSTNVYNHTLEIVNSAEKANVVYCLGDTGLNIIANGSFHADVIDLLSNNLAVVDAPSGKGTGNEIDLEQLLIWNPDVILFAPGSIYQSVGQDAAWQQLNAIKNGTYYEVPFGPYNWVGFPPSVQRYLGMMWMAELLYPETAQYDLFSEIAEYFRLFYHSELTQAQYDELMKNSIGAQQAVKPAA